MHAWASPDALDLAVAAKHGPQLALSGALRQALHVQGQGIHHCFAAFRFGGLGHRLSLPMWWGFGLNFRDRRNRWSSRCSLGNFLGGFRPVGVLGSSLSPSERASGLSLGGLLGGFLDNRWGRRLGSCFLRKGRFGCSLGLQGQKVTAREQRRSRWYLKDREKGRTAEAALGASKRRKVSFRT